MEQEKYVITADCLKAYFRYELPYQKLIPVDVPENCIEYEQYYIQWDDIHSLMQRLQSCNPSVQEFNDNWGDTVYTFLGKDGQLQLYSKTEMDKVDVFCMIQNHQPDNPAEAMYYIILSLVQSDGEVKEFRGKCHCADFIDFDLMNHDIQMLEQQKYNKIKLYLWTDETKAYYIRLMLRDWNKLHSLSEEENALVKKIIEELCAKGYPEGIEAKAYSCFGGNRLYDCDWKFSHNSFLKLMEIENPFESLNHKGRYANSLGYIYNNGLCNNGVPQYDKAFYYYTIGAASECYESVYKLADMFYYGLGTSKNGALAENLVRQVYNETKKLFLRGRYDCEFADAAYRMGNICSGEHINSDNFIDMQRAFQYYLEADLAIGLRMKYVNQLGDSELASHIRSKVKEMRTICVYEEPEERMKYNDVPELFQNLLEERKTVLFMARRLKRRKIEITGKRVECVPSLYSMESGGWSTQEGNSFREKILVVQPEYGLCRLVDQVTYWAGCVTEFWTAGEGDSFKANIMNRSFDSEHDRFEFYRDDELVAYIEAVRYEYRNE